MSVSGLADVRSAWTAVSFSSSDVAVAAVGVDRQRAVGAGHRQRRHCRRSAAVDRPKPSWCRRGCRRRCRWSARCRWRSIARRAVRGAALLGRLQLVSATATGASLAPLMVMVSAAVRSGRRSVTV